MDSAAKIAVLAGPGDAIRSGSYLISALVAAWRGAGMEVSVLEGTDRFEPADVLVLHVDLTVVPKEYLALAARYPLVVNGLVRDISKRKISADVVDRSDGHDGPVIVKTDLNCGGVSEHTLSSNRLFRAFTARLPWTWTGKFLGRTYPIFDSPSAVPRRVWNNSRLLVEKYVPEREGEYYCLRQWVFLGDREVSYRSLSRDPVVKARNVVRREDDVPVPQTLSDIRDRLGFDYGKFDYVIAGGAVHLLDANTTPTMGSRAAPPESADIVNALAAGLGTFLPSVDARAERVYP